MTLLESKCLIAGSIVVQKEHLSLRPPRPSKYTLVASHGSDLRRGRSLVPAVRTVLYEPDDSLSVFVSEQLVLAMADRLSRSPLDGLTSSDASKRGIAAFIRSRNRRETCVFSSSRRWATSLTSSIVPATLRHVLFFRAGLLSRYSRKCVSSCPSMSQNLRLSPSRPQACTERG